MILGVPTLLGRVDEHLLDVLDCLGGNPVFPATKKKQARNDVEGAGFMMPLSNFDQFIRVATTCHGGVEAP
ncbi:MAG TPA: hypothetical protein DIT99_28470 [Candidatus Latescibacteria bacterium]|nr:hypothetical protein [Candidatus Latescibacterota bacterium]